MSKRNDGHARGRYTLEFKLEAVRQVDGGQAVPVTAKILGVPVQTHGNWVRLSEKGLLKGAGDKPVSAEQIELARLRAELARVKMARDILKKATLSSTGRCSTRCQSSAWRFKVQRLTRPGVQLTLPRFNVHQKFVSV